MKRLTGWIRDYWIEIIFGLISLGVIVFALWYRLVSLNNGYSPTELQIHHMLVNHSYTLNYLWHNLTYAPFTLSLMIIQAFGGKDLFAIRGIGAGFGLLTVAMFFYIIYRWYGTLVAILSSTVFLGGLWFLQSARNGETLILYSFGAILLTLIGVLSRARKLSSFLIFSTTIVGVSLIYIPGFIWFILIGVYLQRSYLRDEWKGLPQALKILTILFLLVLIVPILHDTTTNVHLPLTLLGLPSSYSVSAIVSRFWHFPLSLFVYDSTSSIFRLGHMPIINIFNEVMLVLGIYYVWFKRKLNRVKLLFASIILGWLLYSIGGIVPIDFVMPFFMCLVAGGIAYLLKQWFTVFPLNPVARILGICLLAGAVVIVGLFQYNRYFIAWSHTPSTLSYYKSD